MLNIQEVQKANGVKGYLVNGQEAESLKIGRSTISLLVGTEFVARQCTVCRTFMSIDQFSGDIRGIAGKRSVCSKCDSARRAANIRGVNRYGDQKKEAPETTIRFFDEEGKCVRKSCNSCDQIKGRSEFYYHRSTIDKLSTTCKECTADYSQNTYDDRKYKLREIVLRRRKMVAALPNTLDSDAYEDDLESIFDGRCALTGSKDNLTRDHAIPFSSGHVGNTPYNVFPLSKSLNSSKYNNNIFEWVKREDVREQICLERFEKLIEYLASRAGLSEQEYEEFTYWCFNNSRTVEEVEAVGRVDSLFLWNQSKNS